MTLQEVDQGRQEKAALAPAKSLRWGLGLAEIPQPFAQPPMPLDETAMRS
jgi:hypothetical protein